ncbi:MAG TPA: penicillin-binding transpeptidase domain-containing protein [Thermoanaerobaculia bacterium]|nr:penicillin-binding transpeptidase domain-containing protein [Thermoanaerobaculia bacterium]
MTFRKIVAPLLAALFVLAALLCFISYQPVRRAHAEWRANRNAEAIATSQKWLSFPLWRGQHRQILAAAYLTSSRPELAEPHVSSLKRRRPRLTILDWTEVATRLFAAGRYAEYLDFDQALGSTEAKAAVYRAAALVALGRFDEGQRALRLGGDASSLSRAVQKALDERRGGEYPYLFDRRGRPLARLQVPTRQLTAAEPSLVPLLEREAGSLTWEATLSKGGDLDPVDTTLDAEVQRAAANALGSFRGALVVLDPRTDELLAVVSSRGSGKLENIAIETQYEPGSVIKVLTGASAIENNIELQKALPYKCTGDMIIDGRHFGDWLPEGHGALDSLDAALAQSCNLFFADIGLRLGFKRLNRLMQAAGFDAVTDLDLVRPPLGRTIPPVFNNYETAYYAIGLEHQSITALHLSMLASMMANRGMLRAPRLIRGRRSILGQEMAVSSARRSVRIMQASTAERLIQSMVAVTTHPEGTGRRAVVEGLPIALKTGTAGRREAGYHALIMAFAPVEAPRMAIGLIIENSGSAETYAAPIAGSFFAAMKSAGLL